MTRDQFMSLSDQQKWDALLLAESERDEFEQRLAEMRQMPGEVMSEGRQFTPSEIEDMLKPYMYHPITGFLQKG